MIKEADLELSFVLRKYFLYRAIFCFYFSKCGKFSSNFLIWLLVFRASGVDVVTERLGNEMHFVSIPLDCEEIIFFD